MSKITLLRFVILFVIVFTLVAPMLLPEVQQETEIAEKNTDTANFNLAMFKAKDQKWGYMIVKEGKILIKQDVIPALSGNQQFESKSDAEKVGSLVLQKIRNGEVPSIKVQELDSLHIRIDNRI